MTKEELDSIDEDDREIYLKLVEAIICLHKMVDKQYLAKETPLTKNSFLKRILLFESKLSVEDIKELISLANSAHKEEVYGLKLYAKLLELKKCEKIHGDNICDEFYYACVEQSGEIILKSVQDFPDSDN